MKKMAIHFVKKMILIRRKAMEIMIKFSPADMLRKMTNSFDHFPVD